MWVARDESNELWLYKTKPYKLKFHWHNLCGCMNIDNFLFPDVKWEDEEPLEVYLVPAPPKNTDNE